MPRVAKTLYAQCPIILWINWNQSKTSVSNGSKFLVRFWIWVGTKPGPLQRVSTQNPLLRCQNFLLQLCVWVLIVSQHNLYVKHAVWCPLSSQVLWFAIGSILVESHWKTGQFGESSVCNCSNPLERFRVRVGTVTKLLQWVLPHENPDRCNWAGFTSKNPGFKPYKFGSN